MASDSSHTAMNTAMHRLNRQTHLNMMLRNNQEITDGKTFERDFGSIYWHRKLS